MGGVSRGSLGEARGRELSHDLAMNGNPKIYVVEDDLDIARLIRHNLESAGFRVRSYTGTANVLPDAQKERPSLLLLDIMIPGGDGLDLGRQVRGSGSPLAATPIVFLTAKTAEADRVLGLESGADDYITKPFSLRELLARIKAVLRRCERPLAPASISAGELEIEAAAMTLSVRGVTLTTTTTKFRLLHYLTPHPNLSSPPINILPAFSTDTP